MKINESRSFRDISSTILPRLYIFFLKMPNLDHMGENYFVFSRNVAPSELRRLSVITAGKIEDADRHYFEKVDRHKSNLDRD